MLVSGSVGFRGLGFGGVDLLPSGRAKVMLQGVGLRDYKREFMLEGL